MTTWKLLDELGGHSVAVIHKGVGDKPWDVVVDLGDQSFPAQLPATVFTEVKPPLPEEPPVTSFVNAGSRILHRRDDHGIDWYDLASGTWYTWAQLCELGTPVRLVPAPEPVELPARGIFADGNEWFVERHADPPSIWLSIDSTDYQLYDVQASRLARALNTAAEAEATS